MGSVRLKVILLWFVSFFTLAQSEFAIYTIRVVGYEITFTSLVYLYNEQLYFDEETLQSLPLKADANLTSTPLPGCNSCFNLDHLGSYSVDKRNLKVSIWLSSQIVQEDFTRLSQLNDFTLQSADRAHIFNYNLNWGKKSAGADLSYITGYDAFSSELGMNIIKGNDTTQVNYTKALFRYELVDDYLSLTMGKHGLGYGNIIKSESLLGLSLHNNPNYRPANDLYASTSYRTELQGGGKINISRGENTIFKKDLASSVFEIEGLPSNNIQSYQVVISDNKGENRLEYIETLDLTNMLKAGENWWNFGLGALNSEEFSIDGLLVGGFIRSGIRDNINAEGGGAVVTEGFENYFSLDYSSAVGRFASSLQYQDLQGNSRSLLWLNYRLSLPSFSLDFGIPFGDNAWQSLQSEESFVYLNPKAKFHYLTGSGIGWHHNLRVTASYENREESNSWTLALSKSFASRISASIQTSRHNNENLFMLSVNVPLSSRSLAKTSLTTTVTNQGLNQSALSYTHPDVSASLNYSHEQDMLTARGEKTWQQTKGNINAIYTPQHNDFAAGISGSVAATKGKIGFIGQHTESVALITSVGKNETPIDVEVNQGRYTLSNGSLLVPVTSFGLTRLRYLPNDQQLTRLSKISDTVSVGKGVVANLEVKFESAGVLVYFKDINESGIVEINGKQYDYYGDVGAYIDDIEVGNYQAILKTDSGRRCISEVDVGIEFQELLFLCLDEDGA
jgi:hypothetical protein